MARVGGVYPNSGLKGFDIVLSNLNKAILQIEHGSARGLALSVALIRRSTETKPPLTPVDLGNLRASFFSEITTLKDSGLPQIANEKGALIKEGHFKGPNASKLYTGYKNATSEAKGLVNARRDDILAMFGYSAFYAAPVHENQEMHFQRPGAGPKWFQEAVNGNSSKILQIIRDNAAIKR